MVTELDEELRTAALGLMFEQQGEEVVRRVAADDPALERIYARFRACADSMLDQAARRRSVPWESALELATDRAAGLDWWLTGSAAAAVRGADVAPRDVDLVLSLESALVFADRFAAELVEPLARSGDWIADVFGRAFAGARVEWIGGFRAELDEHGRNEFGPATAARLEEIPWRGRKLRVPPLDVQIAVAEQRALSERVAALEALS